MTRRSLRRGHGVLQQQQQQEGGARIPVHRCQRLVAVVAVAVTVVAVRWHPLLD